MNNFIEYKGYTGTVAFSAEDNILHGKVIGIRGLISYEGNSIEELKTDFREAVDFYLSHCAETGKEPIKPYCGNLSDIQISPNTHRIIYSYSERTKKTPSQTVEEAVKKYIYDAQSHNEAIAVY
ncbi:MAG: type II toxin-antitoxin system HicB family antitoxin [Defluviitaleaceae bacterium]|nr:type II toxin-antitoxin system HicB family antitoxin [Defluviitaleaceae bacterium]